MISVPSHQQLLNGNKLFFFLLVIFFYACSPKVVKPPIVAVSVPVKPVIEEAKKPVKVASPIEIAVLIPFQLDKYNLRTVSKDQLAEAEMPIDFYQGLMMGIETYSNTQTQLKVNVYDTHADKSRLFSLSKNEDLLKSQLIIGPIFPNEVKKMSTFAVTKDIAMVSPLAAAMPSEFQNSKLISIIPDIELHAEKLAHYIAETKQPKETIVVLINSGALNEGYFAKAFRTTFTKNYPSFFVQEYSSTQVLETKIQKDKDYMIVFSSDDSRFVAPSLSRLMIIKNLLNTDRTIQLFGHPNWIKQNYNLEQLKIFKTIISSSYFVDYKRSNVNSFVKAYRDKYKFEPSEFAIKAYDIGKYFASLLSKYGLKYLDYVLKEKYKGLHNDFDFYYDSQNGYFNKHLKLLQYRNQSLQLIEE